MTAVFGFSRYLVLIAVVFLLLAALAVFIFSGLLHEAVMSVPAEGGYGGPFAYFIIQYLGILTQRELPIFNNRLFTWLILTVPLPWFFHEPFFNNIFKPLVFTIGGQS